MQFSTIFTTFIAVVSLAAALPVTLLRARDSLEYAHFTINNYQETLPDLHDNRPFDMQLNAFYSWQIPTDGTIRGMSSGIISIDNSSNPAIDFRTIQCQLYASDDSTGAGVLFNSTYPARVGQDGNVRDVGSMNCTTVPVGQNAVPEY